MLINMNLAYFKYLNIILLHLWNHCLMSLFNSSKFLQLIKYFYIIDVTIFDIILKKIQIVLMKNQAPTIQ